MPRGNDIAPGAASRQRELADTAATDFDASPIHNRVHDDIVEDQQLAVLLDAAARTREASEYRDNLASPTRTDDLDQAADRISHVARDRRHEIVAQACASIITEGDTWAAEGHWDRETVAAAQREARDWLQVNTNAAERVGVLDVLADADPLEVVCGQCGCRYELTPTTTNECPECGFVDWEVA